MSDERDGRREARGARPAHRSLGEGGLDTAIDGAVRAMLDVEPPPGLRGRVMDRIDHHGPVASAFRRKGAWIFAPVAAAAVIALAVLAPWRDAAMPAGTTPAAIARNAPPATPPDVAPPVVTPRTPQPPEPAGA